MSDLVIVGAGGFGREVYQWLKDDLRARAREGQPVPHIKGFLSENPDDLRGFTIDLGVIGSPREYVIEDGDRFLLAIGTVRPRIRVAQELRQRGAQFYTLVHPTAVVAETAILGEGVVVCPFAIVNAYSKIGDLTMFNAYASCGHDVQIGNFCVLSPYATVNGFGILEDEVFLGTHAAVTPGKRVGAGSQVSANSVAADDVPPRTLVMGVPGKKWTIFSE